MPSRHSNSNNKTKLFPHEPQAIKHLSLHHRSRGNRPSQQTLSVGYLGRKRNNGEMGGVAQGDSHAGKRSLSSAQAGCVCARTTSVYERHSIGCGSRTSTVSTPRLMTLEQLGRAYLIAWSLRYVLACPAALLPRNL